MHMTAASFHSQSSTGSLTSSQSQIEMTNLISPEHNKLLQNQSTKSEPRFEGEGDIYTNFDLVINNNDCPICLSDIEDEENQTIALLAHPAQTGLYHPFCETCAKEIIKRDTLCPLCRQTISSRIKIATRLSAEEYAKHLNQQSTELQANQNQAGSDRKVSAEDASSEQYDESTGRLYKIIDQIEPLEQAGDQERGCSASLTARGIVVGTAYVGMIAYKITHITENLVAPNMSDEDKDHWAMVAFGVSSTLTVSACLLTYFRSMRQEEAQATL